MSQAHVVDMTHFEGIRDPMREIPATARRIGEYYGSIVEAATASWFTDVTIPSAVRCRRRPRRRSCRGYLRLRLASDAARIFWACRACDDHGVLAGWRTGPWDLSDVAVAAAPDGWAGWSQVRMSEPEYRALLRVALLGERATERVLKAAQTARDGISLGAPRPEIETLLDLAEAEASHATKRKTRALLERVAERLAAALD